MKERDKMKQSVQGFTKITVTVNGKRVGSDLYLDKETYVPVAREYVNLHEQPEYASREPQMV
jgi:hypothetical protein